MGRLRLSFVSAFNERVQPLMDGTIQPEGLELIPTYSDPSETFWRQLRFQEFEISEMSLSSYLIAKSRGMDMIAIPVFPSRQFWHLRLSYHADSGIQQPGDIVGKRIGVGEYQQTASLWVRGILEHDFGVSQYKVHWYMERSEELSHGGATGFKPPQGISFHRIPPDKSLASMLVAHELDVAAVNRAFQKGSNIIDRSTQIRAADGDWTKIKPLFPDPMAEGIRFFTKHGYIPANHTYIIRGDIYRQNPWIAFNLYTAFVKAKEIAQENLAESIPSGLIFGREYLAQTRKVFGADPYPFGVKANRPLLETLVAYSAEQGLIPNKFALEELFAPSTLDL
jgi:4,5-dihydroxyphthalate decarboxylase